MSSPGIARVIAERVALSKFENNCGGNCGKIEPRRSWTVGSCCPVSKEDLAAWDVGAGVGGVDFGVVTLGGATIVGATVGSDDFEARRNENFISVLPSYQLLKQPLCHGK